mgnify:CR=1 FL=1
MLKQQNKKYLTVDWKNYPKRTSVILIIILLWKRAGAFAIIDQGCGAGPFSGPSIGCPKYHTKLKWKNDINNDIITSFERAKKKQIKSNIVSPEKDQKRKDVVYNIIDDLGYTDEIQLYESEVVFLL